MEPEKPGGQIWNLIWSASLAPSICVQSVLVTVRDFKEEAKRWGERENSIESPDSSTTSY